MAALLGSLLAVVYDVRDEGRYPGRLMVLGLVGATVLASGDLVVAFGPRRGLEAMETIRH